MDAHATTAHEHITSIRTYLVIFGLLMALTAVTTWVAFHDFGAANNFIMLGIAITKATLVILYFMHVRYSSGLTWLLVVSGFAWLALMIALTMSDVVTRGLLGVGFSTPVAARTPAAAHAAPAAGAH